MNYLERYKLWCTDECFDESTKQELRGLSDEAIRERFGEELQFGTGGLRGIIGAGCSRINIYTIKKATQGLADFINLRKQHKQGVVIAYDSRHMSLEFAQEAALCLCANGIKAYVFDSLRPTPELSFAIPILKCVAGIVITASHNPAQYNGYKVYWEDGGQIVEPFDRLIGKHIHDVTDYNKIKTMSKDEAVIHHLWQTIGSDMDNLYIAQLKKLVLHPELIQKLKNNLTIVYSPLHGAGNEPVQRILKELGFKDVYIVSKQEYPDGGFPTVASPNPEDEKAFTLALQLAHEVNADIILATDPDGDRLGFYAKNKASGEYVSFSGNMAGILIGDYIGKERKKQGLLPINGAFISTIVSTNMASKIASEYNMEYRQVLTGFKYIGEQIKLFKESGKFEFVFGFEESNGCLTGIYARDKDAIAAAMTICEAAAFYKSQGMTLWDRMMELYNKYGFYKEELITINLEGQKDSLKSTEFMKKIRNHPITEIADWQVYYIKDYKNNTSQNKRTNEIKPTGLPLQNVLYYELSDEAWFCFRPSGTEPKIKIYMGVKGISLQDAKIRLMELKQEIRKMIG